jgi:CubicO group peptidase (beta-lactamase class C family)
MFERVFTPLGITKKDLTWRNNAYRPREIDGVPRREFGSGISADVNAMARIGYLYLRRGKWKDRQIIPADFVDQARTTVPGVVGLPEHRTSYNTGMGNASDHYGLLWWNNADGTIVQIPRSTYWSWGLYDSLIVVFPELEVVVARAGKSWKRESKARHYDVLRPFLVPIAASVRSKLHPRP